jgi:cyclic pyranopterin monophosphate synthase
MMGRWVKGANEDMKEGAGELTHVDEQGRLRMVDVTEKEASWREARAEGTVHLARETLKRICDKTITKGNVLEAARLAGILASKRTWELIPLCHPIQVTGVDVDFETAFEDNSIRILSRVATRDRTGVEMEALVAVTHAALTIYDMCKAIDRDMTIDQVRLTYKSGGRSGTYERA